MSSVKDLIRPHILQMKPYAAACDGFLRITIVGGPKRIRRSLNH